MNLAGDYAWNDSHFHDDSPYSFDSYYRYRLLLCPVCIKANLLYYYHDDSMTCPKEAIEETLYPSGTTESALLPKTVQDAFASALKVRNADLGACSIMLRRALEIILIDQGATAWRLEGKIKEVAEMGRLPESLKEASLFAKAFGDSVAHGKELIPDKNDINSLVEFIQYIIDYLYIIPAKIEQFQAKINRTEKDVTVADYDVITDDDDHPF